MMQFDNIYYDWGDLSPLSLSDQLQIQYNILGCSVKLKEPVLSPFRSDNNIGSCQLENYKDNIVLTDYSVRKYHNINIIDGIKLKYNCNFHQAVQIVGNILNKPLYKIGKLRSVPKKQIHIAFGTKLKDNLPAYSYEDVEYQKSYGITISELYSDQVYSISQYSVNGIVTYTKDCSYAMCLNNRVKIYRPFQDKKNKQKCNTNLEDYQYFDHQSKILVITSSYKDARVVYNNTKYDVITLQSETQKITDNQRQFIEDKAYDKIYVIMDGDQAGDLSCDEYQKYGYTCVYFPFEHRDKINSFGKTVKDIAELYRYNPDELYKFLNEDIRNF